MSNRRKIEGFAKQQGVKLLRCEFVRNTEYCYSDLSDASSWQVTIEIGGKQEFYDSYFGLGVDDDVARMLCEMKYDIEEARQNNAE